jgi:hypothetical protein
VIALLIPVLGRPQQIKPLLASVAENTSSAHRVVFIFSPGDTAIEEAKDSQALLLTATWQPGKADYAKKLALGFEQTDEPWLFQGATDLVFYPGWDVYALKLAERTGCGVVGTNDLGNPLVKRGRHSTHSLFARSYITHYGGTSDGTGLIFSEAYDHQWTDSEFIETATRRRQFVFSKRSIVEHLHPHWGKSEMDATYEKAHRSTSHDQRMFMQRRGKIARLDQERLRMERQR